VFLRPLALCAAVALAGAAASRPAATADAPPLRGLLVIGGCCHDYAKQKDILTKGLSERANVSWTVAYDPDKGTKHLNPIYGTDDWAKGYDIVVHDECTADVKDAKIVERILKPHRDGVPALVIHCGMHCYRTEGFPKSTPWFDFTGLATTGHGPQAPIEITYPDKESPVTKGLSPWTTVNEELYNNSNGKLLETAKEVARGKQTVTDKKKNTSYTSEAVVAWTNTYNGKTKVFGTTLGHNNDTVADAKYLDLLANGLLWATGKADDAAYRKPAKSVLLDK
jgi:type 1 glutamine amidotransferase